MDHYQILGIDKKASRDEIKRAYRKLALAYHPDKTHKPDAEKFRAVNEAYKILSDVRKRDSYDKFDLPLHKKESQRSQHHHSSSSSHHYSRHHRQPKRDDNFFKGASEALNQEQKYQNELDRIRRINSDLLDEANAKLRRASRKSSARDKVRDRPSGGSAAIYLDEIITDEDIEKKEEEILANFREFSKRNITA